MVAKSFTVAERRKAIRERDAMTTDVMKDPPKVRARGTLIDLSKSNARDRLTEVFPRPEDEVMLKATPDLEALALAFVEARDDATLANRRKERAGNALCHAIGKHLGIEGDGWKATWSSSQGGVDWSALASALNVSVEVIEKFRKPDTRVLNVREVAEE